MFMLWYRAPQTEDEWRPLCWGPSLQRLSSLAARLEKRFALGVRITRENHDAPQRWLVCEGDGQLTVKVFPCPPQPKPRYAL